MDQIHDDQIQFSKNRIFRAERAAHRSAESAELRSKIYHKAKQHFRWRLGDDRLFKSTTIACKVLGL